jgi:hypothetical protein
MTTAFEGEGRCGHRSCGCMATERHGGYCSLYCANAEGDAPPSGACACDHPACGEARQQRKPDDQDVQTAVGNRTQR